MALRKQFVGRKLSELGIRDAREVLNAKGLKSGYRRGNAGRISKPRQQTFGNYLPNKTVRNDLAFNKRTRPEMQGKQVKLKGGLLLVTSKLTSPKKSSYPPDSKPPRFSRTFEASSSHFASQTDRRPDKQVHVNKNGISVTTVNNLARANNFSRERPEIVEEDDDLEKMTLDDLPDFKKSKPSTPAYRMSRIEKTVSPVSSSLKSRLSRPSSSALPQDSYSSTNGACTLITNLHPRVSDDDIKELFEDIGPIESAKLLSPGTALVTFYNRTDAVTACSLYHGRLLDGQPMQCSLLSSGSTSPRSISSVSRNSTYQTAASRFSTIPSRFTNYVP